MPIPGSIADLSRTSGQNSPPGSDSPSVLDDHARTAYAFIATLRDGMGFSNPVDLASAATTDIGAQPSMTVRITGTSTITSFGTNYNGPRFLVFGGSLTLTHNASSLILPGGVSIATAAGDTCIAVPNLASPTGWRVLAFQRAEGNGDEVTTVKAFARNTAPNGWLKANGAAVSRTTYAALFAAMGTTFGAGDGSTTFNLPDLRGEFIRGWDDGRGVDAGRVFGSAQAGQNASHSHTGTALSAGSHQHGTAGDGIAVTAGGQGVRYWGDGAQLTGAAGAHTHTLSINTDGGTEARSRNVALLVCIKY